MTAPRPRRAALSVAAAVLVLLSGCATHTDRPNASDTASDTGRDTGSGSGSGSGSSTVTAADQRCREEWRDFQTEVAAARAKLAGLTARTFASRWDSLESGVAYYMASATANDCADMLDDDRTDLRQLNSVAARSKRFDISWRLAQQRQARKAWRAEHPDGSEPANVTAAYRILQRKAPAADLAVTPAMNALAEADPADSAALDRAVRDLNLLARNSADWVLCDARLATARKLTEAPASSAPNS